MSYMLEDLMINRVDLVNEGANSEAFIELYKRKEQSRMNVSEIISKLKPEHAKVIQEALDAAEADVKKAKDDAADLKATLEAKETELEALKKAKCGEEQECECDGEEDDEGLCKVCGKPKKKTAKTKSGVNGLDEAEVIKSMPEAARDLYNQLKAQKEAAEELVRKNAEDQKQAEAVAKAATLKALPVAQESLVEVIKSASPEMLEVLTSINAAIEGTVLDEVGKSAGNGAGTAEADPWAAIEKKADEIAARDSVTKQRAITMVIKENPELYREYLNGGAN